MFPVAAGEYKGTWDEICCPLAVRCPHLSFFGMFVHMPLQRFPHANMNCYARDSEERCKWLGLVFCTLCVVVCLQHKPGLHLRGIAEEDLLCQRLAVVGQWHYIGPQSAVGFFSGGHTESQTQDADKNTCQMIINRADYEQREGKYSQNQLLKDLAVSAEKAAPTLTRAK